MKKSTFTDTVRTIVSNIPKGEVRTYKEVATAAGNPRAARAVARVMSTNYLKNVPCHRVICTNGTLGGYNIERRDRETLSEELVDTLEKISYELNSNCNGVEIKRKILRAEGINI